MFTEIGVACWDTTFLRDNTWEIHYWSPQYPRISDSYVHCWCFMPRDMNLPKFIKDDERLFRLLLGDLFPSLELPVSEYGALQVQTISTYSDDRCHRVRLSCRFRFFGTSGTFCLPRRFKSLLGERGDRRLPTPDANGKH